uniref:hypothetical protein n=1 Tax=Enterobacter sp. TaxID=42895 RepID=UPI00296EFD89|nr:hypothetical protein [Enterobacter sp.]
MPTFKQRVEKFSAQQLLRAGVPEKAIPESLKKTGRGMILASVMLVVPLLLAEGIPLPVIIVMQLGYAALLCLGIILAFDDDKPSR